MAESKYQSWGHGHLNIQLTEKRMRRYRIPDQTAGSSDLLMGRDQFSRMVLKPSRGRFCRQVHRKRRLFVANKAPLWPPRASTGVRLAPIEREDCSSAWPRMLSSLADRIAFCIPDIWPTVTVVLPRKPIKFGP